MKSNQNSHSLSVKLGAALLVATSVIGPGLLTQTSRFAAKYSASFVFVILCVIIMNVVARTNIRSVIGVSDRRGRETTNAMLPGLGVFLTLLVVLGDLISNIGNVGGVALGFGATFGLHEKVGAVLGGVFAICISLSKSGRAAVDKVAQILDGIITPVVLFVVVSSKPPVGKAVVRMFTPERPGSMVGPMLTLLGGSCGNYITLSGAYRLFDAGYSSNEGEVSHFRQSVLTGISVSDTVCVLLFLCVLGVCTQGTALVTVNVDAIIGAKSPTTEVFRLVAGNLDHRLSGLALFSAGITSVIGVAYTSVSLLETLHPCMHEYESQLIVGFITFSALAMAVLGSAEKMAIFVGVISGLIFPISLCCMLFACRNPKVVGKDYYHPMVLYIIGWVVIIFSVYLAIMALPNFGKLFS